MNKEIICPVCNKLANGVFSIADFSLEKGISRIPVNMYITNYRCLIIEDGVFKVYCHSGGDFEEIDKDFRDKNENFHRNEE